MIINKQQLKEKYDLIIIGSGPAGITLAKEFEQLNPNKSLLIIESGNDDSNDTKAHQLSENYASGSLSKDHYKLHNQRNLGGTSTIWAGYCAVLEKRAFLNNEWPISYEELYKNYPKAAQILELPNEVHSRAEVPFENNKNIVYKPYYLSPPTRFNNPKFKRWLTQNKNCDLLFNHTVTMINIIESKVTNIEIMQTLDGIESTHKLESNNIVLACGGIQNAKLLKQTLPNSSLPIGQYLQEHPHIYGQAVITLDKLEYIKLRDNKAKKIVHAIAFDSQYSLHNKVLSATFEVPKKVINDSKQNILGQFKNTITFKSNIRMEMPALQKNIVNLSSTQTDFLGTAKPEIHMDFDIKTVKDAFNKLSEELINSGLGRVKALPETFKIYGGGHMIGTTRMGLSKQTSVVDKNCKVHDIQNLFVAGSSVYPAGAAANPTLTIVNLALRLAQHLSGNHS